MQQWLADVAAIMVGVVLAELIIRSLRMRGYFPEIQ